MNLNNDSLRQEVKYKISYAELPRFHSWLRDISDLKQAYPPRQINSLYLDTPNYSLARANMFGLSSRIKVRGRWYSEEPDRCATINSHIPETKVSCEIKRKSNSYSDKINAGSQNISLQDKSNIELYSDVEHFCKMACVENGLRYARDLRKSAFICYYRYYYKSNSINQLRLTIDSDVRYSTPISAGRPILLSKDYMIVEVKFPPSIRDLVVRYFEEFPFRTIRSSKYINAITRIKRVPY